MELMRVLHPRGMKQISHVSIPTPCTQNWDSMLHGNGKNYCNNCQKTVVDFTRLSDAEILQLLSASQKVCGRFNSSQLMALNNQTVPQQQSSLFTLQKMSLAAAFIAAVPFVNVQAEVKAPVVQSPYAGKSTPLVRDTASALRKITGTVTDGKDGLVGASVSIKGTQIITTVDINGNFVLNIPQSANLVLVVSFIGYNQIQLKIDPNQNVYKIEMKGQQTLLGEVVVVRRRPPLWKRPYYALRRVARKIF